VRRRTTRLRHLPIPAHPRATARRRCRAHSRRRGGVRARLLVASKQAPVDRSADERHFYVQVAVFVVAGLGWALAHPGPQRALRAGLGAAAGAVAGVVGVLALGSTEQHVEALGDEVFSGSSAGRALLWAAVTAAA
jgi:hypothetical protein